MEKDSARYTSKRIDISSLLRKEEVSINKKLDLGNLLESDDAEVASISNMGRSERQVRHVAPGEYIVVISMVITSLYLLVTSFFPLVYNVVTSFEPINFLMNLFYFILGIGVLSGAFLVLKKETHLEHIADDTFDEVIYKRLEPVLRDVAVVQVGLDDVHNKLEMMNLNIEKLGQVKEQVNAPATTTAPSFHMSMYIKYVVLINITLATFLFMLQYPLEYIPYAVTLIYILWWIVITGEFKIWNVESVWMWVFVPILILPVYTIIMNAYLRDYQMFGSLFIGLALYIVLYYSWCTNMVRGVLPFDLHVAVREFRKKLEEKTREEKTKDQKPLPVIKLNKPMKLDLHKIGMSLVIGSIILFTAAWFGYSIQHGLIPNISWKTLGQEQFIWEPLYSYALTFFGVILLVSGFGIILKGRRSHD